MRRRWAKAGYNSTFVDRETQEDAGFEARVGYEAPPFTLETVDRVPFSLSDLRGTSHVVLVFGSIT